MGCHRSKKLRGLIDCGAHQFTAGAAAANSNSPGSSMTAGNEVFGAIHEVVKGVGSLAELAGLIPVIAQVVPAPNVRDGKAKATLQQ